MSEVRSTPGQGFTGSHSYDLSSIMHYSQHAFSANTLPTITPRHGGGEEAGDMGQRRHLTQGDRDKVAKSLHNLDYTPVSGVDCVRVRGEGARHEGPGGCALQHGGHQLSALYTQ